jgi:hypothetical protein
VHLRPPSVDHGVQAFIWAVDFCLFLWLGMLAIGISGGAAFMLALICGALIFLFVRVLGEDELARPPHRVPRRWRP